MCLVSGVVALAGCDVGCDTDLRAIVTPQQQVMHLADWFTPTIRLLGCGGTKELSDEFTWTGSDSSVLRVDPVTGRTLGISLGSAMVTVTGKRYGTVAMIPVTVQ